MQRWSRPANLLSVLLSGVIGCAAPERGPAAQPNAPSVSSAASRPLRSPAAAEPTASEKPTATASGPRRSPGGTAEAERPGPKRPKPTWVVFREAFREEADAAIDSKWLGGNRFEIKTKNVRRMTIDMLRPPAGAPDHGPWVLNIDGQGLEMTGFKPRKPGYTGRKRDLIRSRNGKWTFDRKKFYRVGD
ncbi:MAG: hypothetical protein ACE5E1_03850 [Phycisphaerae bacterium]